MKKDEETINVSRPNVYSLVLIYFHLLVGLNSVFAVESSFLDLEREVIGSAVLVHRPIRICITDDDTPILLDHRGKDRFEISKIVSPKGNKGSSQVVNVVTAKEISDFTVDGDLLYLVTEGSLKRVLLDRDAIAVEPPTVLLRGLPRSPFRTVLSMGPDGWLYLAMPKGNHAISGSDGIRLKLIDTGAIVRCLPDGSRLQEYATGLLAPKGITFDPLGEVFVDDGAFIHVPELADVSKRRSILSLKKTDGENLVILPEDSTSDGSLRCLSFDVKNRALVQSTLVPVGLSFRRSRETIVRRFAVSDRFVPQLMTVRTPQEIYVVERSEGGGYIISLLRGKKSNSHEQIRLTEWAKLSVNELSKKFWQQNPIVRQRAGREFLRRGEKARSELLSILEKEANSPDARFTALRYLQGKVNAHVLDVCTRLLSEGNHTSQRIVLRWVERIAQKGDRAVGDVLAQLVTSEDLVVRRGATLALAKLGPRGTESLLATTWNFDTSDNPLLQDAFTHAFERLGHAGIEALLTLANSGVQRDSDRVVQLYLSLSSSIAFSNLVQLLQHPHLSNQQRSELLTSVENYRLDPPVDGDALIEYVVRNDNRSALEVPLLRTLGSRSIRSTSKARNFAVDLLTRKSSSEESRTRALSVLLKSSDGIEQLTALLRGGKIPPEFAKKVQATIDSRQRLKNSSISQDRPKH